MASPTSTPEASEIRRRGRQRLIGAVALALLLVVFVPMILDSEPRPARNESALEIPAKENAPPLPAPTAPPKAQPAAPAEPPKVESAPPKQEQPAPPTKQPAPAAKAAPVDTAPRLEGFAVQVGAFKDDDKLKQARDKLAAAGIRHYVERRDTPAGELRRLRAGPFPTREAAEKALASVKAASLDGQVVPLP
jgi:DedD protein